jgi:hypothetical protein
MKAAVISATGGTPGFGDFVAPAGRDGFELITVSASALSQFSRSRSSGSHYSAEGAFPAVAGADGVGRTEDGRRVYFVLPESPFGALAEKSLVRRQQCVSGSGEPRRRNGRGHRQSRHVRVERTDGTCTPAGGRNRACERRDRLRRQARCGDCQASGGRKNHRDWPK